MAAAMSICTAGEMLKAAAERSLPVPYLPSNATRLLGIKGAGSHLGIQGTVVALLPLEIQRRARFQICLPVQVGGFDEAEAGRQRGVQEEDVCREQLVVSHLHHLPYSHFSPRDLPHIP